ncbi:MAG: 6-phosphogluconolactonase [Myxococcales bacterium]|nr:6-phosphogluconolactonase [Myxococcales bacterium]
MARVVYVGDEEILGRACELVVAALRDAVRAKGHARLAIAGGSASEPLRSIREALGSDWELTWLTWVDERCVDRADKDSNRGAAYREEGLLDSDPPGLELPLWPGGETPEECIARVESSLEDDFGGALDVALLGMGADGHIASLFPEHPVLLFPGTSAVAQIKDSPKPPAQRMTLTLPFLKKTGQNILIAMGESKRDALERIVSGDTALPATTLSNLVVLTNINLSQHEAAK